MRLGKLPAKYDARTLKLKNIIKTALLPPLPASFDVDIGLAQDLPEGMFGNDQWGDCVIVGRANWTLRAEYFEQKKILPITTKEVLKEYWKEQGACCGFSHPDNGLVMLDSLNAWRKGWKTSERLYYIDAFAAIDPKDHKELCYATMLLSGGYIGFYVTDDAMDQFNKGEMWTVTNGNVIGGHAVYIVGFNSTGPICVTWGKKQPMTWGFFDKYCDEAYGLVDRMNSFTPNSPVDVVKLRGYLDALHSV